MPHPHRKTTRTLALLVLLFLTASIVLRAQTPDTDARFHIRTPDLRLQRLIQDGMRASSTFRGMVERLRQSDVVVYIECSGPAGDGGRLAFMSAVGGYRYLHVRVARLSHEDQQVAMLGHELRHAVEVADAPAIVDADTLAREYTRIGYVNPRVVNRLAFDSEAAVQAGHAVLREMVRASGNVLQVARGD